MTSAIFSYTYTHSQKKNFHHCFPQKIRAQTTVQLCILQDYSSVRIAFNMNNKCHILPLVYTMLV